MAKPIFGIWIVFIGEFAEQLQGSLVISGLESVFGEFKICLRWIDRLQSIFLHRTDHQGCNDDKQNGWDGRPRRLV